MKNLIKYGFIALVICFLSSCEGDVGFGGKRNPEPLEKYSGGIIYDLGYGYEFIVKTKDNFKKVQVYRLDYERYDIGDTIK